METGKQVIGVILLIAGFAIAIQMTKEANSENFNGKHQVFGMSLIPYTHTMGDMLDDILILGLILFILTSLSFIGALFRKSLPSYNVWRLGHRSLGWLLLVWSMVCVFTGLNAYGAPKTYTGLVAGAIVIYAIITAFLEVRSALYWPINVSHSLFAVQETQERRGKIKGNVA